MKLKINLRRKAHFNKQWQYAVEFIISFGLRELVPWVQILVEDFAKMRERQ